VCTARTGGVGQAELIGVEQQSVGVVDFEDLLLTIETVFLLCEGIDQAVAEGAGQRTVFALGSFDFVGVGILILLNLSFVLVLR
jgi:hypothetical protein